MTSAQSLYPSSADNTAHRVDTGNPLPVCKVSRWAQTAQYLSLLPLPSFQLRWLQTHKISLTLFCAVLTGFHQVCDIIGNQAASWRDSEKECKQMSGYVKYRLSVPCERSSQKNWQHHSWGTEKTKQFVENLCCLTSQKRQNCCWRPNILVFWLVWHEAFLVSYQPTSVFVKMKCYSTRM